MLLQRETSWSRLVLRRHSCAMGINPLHASTLPASTWSQGVKPFEMSCGLCPRDGLGGGTTLVRSMSQVQTLPVTDARGVVWRRPPQVDGGGHARAPRVGTGHWPFGRWIDLLESLLSGMHEELEDKSACKPQEDHRSNLSTGHGLIAGSRGAAEESN